ncbi:mitochondrial fission ELM1 family protein [Marinobacterium sediminicola]|uniref:mitochondrial fission ELM1 family protein n=1 Tax=Marinobacterium sediminicola TaxID=518898 RepID=UPI001EF0D04F|nr:mitochondrial fission ELM1 family protein [Marinobacterium sediminicola]ULG69105.1 mitochondrial fission ELM1 family protein [Marinobacterium sediminicola]
MSGSDNSKQIWIVSDGKPGHLNQSRGLAEAIARRCDVCISEQPPMGKLQALRLCFSAGLPRMDEKPTLIIGAGHATHLTLLALRRFYRAPAVVLMQPSLSTGFFDLCLIPEHDQPHKRPNIITTRGALNRMQPGEKVPGSGVVLIGGPSKHFDWDETAVLSQVEALLAAEPRQWLIGSSRRTPASTEQALAALAGGRFVPAAETGPDWLPQQLGRAEVCWVTQDSASMVYEALTAGCKVGVLTLDEQADNRISRGVDELRAQGLVSRAPDWTLECLSMPGMPFNEAERCAEAILKRGWL